MLGLPTTRLSGGTGKGACLSFLALISAHLPGAVVMGVRQVVISFLPVFLAVSPCDPGLTCLLYFGCEPSAYGIGESYIFTVLPGMVSAICAAGVGSGVSPCVYICVYVYRAAGCLLLSRSSAASTF